MLGRFVDVVTHLQPLFLYRVKPPAFRKLPDLGMVTLVKISPELSAFLSVSSFFLTTFFRHFVPPSFITCFISAANCFCSLVMYVFNLSKKRLNEIITGLDCYTTCQLLAGPNLNQQKIKRISISF